MASLNLGAYPTPDDNQEMMGLLLQLPHPS